MRFAQYLLAALLAGAELLGTGTVQARTTSVVTFESKEGIVFLDSKNSIAAYRLFESLNVPVVTRALTQTKILAPEDGLFRISCSAVSLDYSCAVIVYAGAYAHLEFETDQVELDLPANIAGRYTGIFAKSGPEFHFRTEDGQLAIDWTPQRLHIYAPGRSRGRDI